MDKNNSIKAIEILIKKAAETVKSEDALRFSQAANNIANSMFAIKNSCNL